MEDQHPTTEQATEVTKPPRKKRAPRKKKGSEPEANAETPPAGPATFQQTVDTVIAEAARDQPSEAIKQPRPPAEHVNGHHAELQGAKPRKSGRRAWDINLGQGEHTWERVETPATDGAPSEVVFRFKIDPSDAQLALIDRYGFKFDPESKEAYRANDIAGRTYADKLAWFLKDLERNQGEGRSV